MKTNLLLITILLNFSISVFSQSGLGVNEKTNLLEYWTEFDPKKKEYREPKKILAGYISQNTTLYSRDTYLLEGTVYVINNAVLTIEQGTVIRGDEKTNGTLVITKGAKIIAEGTESFPIVFTTNKDSYSRKPGDWGGIVIMGDAPVNNFGGIGILNFDLDPSYNRYGGSNKEASSGVLKYVRVEYAGRKINSKKEFNGITFAGVGSGTKIENVQVSYSNDDSFEFYGGNVKLKNLVSYRASDDDFDFTQGVQVEINNSLAIRNPYSSDLENSRCFEINSNDDVEKFDPLRDKTSINASNMVLVNTEDNNQGLIKEALFVSNDSKLNFSNSVVFGFKDFLMLKDFSILEDFDQHVKIKDLVIGHCDNPLSSLKPKDLLTLDINYLFTKNNIVLSDGKIEDYFMNSNLHENPDFRYLKIERNKINYVNK
ncbi:conserved exported hypothetical protein [Flavobacterium sp. 9AF]|uniref:hypothetical protein n=1 Tax=Flavobacterium sp. 9AF TaxID=2653142 RepID=UPI0012F1AE9C|nr:hypothetical protein [Flavobacterium sp. 9AF]VXB10670.1 conserved exported hypothetical protein [Flavobacterium sp. 9AF]